MRSLSGPSRIRRGRGDARGRPARQLTRSAASMVRVCHASGPPHLHLRIDCRRRAHTRHRPASARPTASPGGAIRTLAAPVVQEHRQAEAEGESDGGAGQDVGRVVAIAQDAQDAVGRGEPEVSRAGQGIGQLGSVERQVQVAHARVPGRSEGLVGVAARKGVRGADVAIGVGVGIALAICVGRPGAADRVVQGDRENRAQRVRLEAHHRHLQRDVRASSKERNEERVHADREHHQRTHRRRLPRSTRSRAPRPSGAGTCRGWSRRTRWWRSSAGSSGPAAGCTR